MLDGTARRDPDAAPRSVTILGATGSIGSSTIDLMKRQPGRFAVEAVTAHKNSVALAKLARDMGARFAAVGDPDAYGELKWSSPARGSRLRRARMPLRGRTTPGRMGDRGDHRSRRPKPTLAAIERGATGGARQQGMPGLRRRAVHAPRQRSRRDRSAGR